MNKLKKYYTAKYEAIFMYVVNENQKILKALLENILKISIDEIEVKNTKLVASNIRSRSQNLDLLIKSDNKYISVELNTNYNHNLVNRNILYVCKVAVDSCLRGRDFSFDNKIFQINLNFDYKGRKYIEEYILKENEDNKILSDIIKIYNVNIDNAKEMYYNDNREFIFNNLPVIMLDLPKEELDKLSKESEIVDDFLRKLEEANDDEQFQWVLTAEEEAAAWEKLNRETALKEKEAAFKEGIEQGFERGNKQGIEKSKYEIAKKMIKEQIDINTISNITGLSIEKIEELI